MKKNIAYFGEIEINSPQETTEGNQLSTRDNRRQGYNRQSSNRIRSEFL